MWKILTILILTLTLARPGPTTERSGELEIVGHAYYDPYQETYHEVERIRAYSLWLSGKRKSRSNPADLKTVRLRLDELKPQKTYYVEVLWDNGFCYYTEVVTSPYRRVLHVYEP